MSYGNPHSQCEWPEYRCDSCGQQIKHFGSPKKGTERIRSRIVDGEVITTWHCAECGNAEPAAPANVANDASA